MKHLLLIRHATAEHDYIPNSDFDRVLDAQGKAEAEKLGRFLAVKKAIPNLILCSSAKRTKATAELLNQQLKVPAEILLSRSLYNADFQELLEALHEVDSEVDCLALVAHNPGISQLATVLSESSSYQMAPAAALFLSFNILNWKDISAGKGIENWYFYP
jgi:phosphohistidine phosphatase